MLDFLSRPWPWYVAGPIIGLVVPALLLLGNRVFGVSENLRHMCAATIPGKVEFLRYDWRAGKWNLTFIAGTVIGGFIAHTLLYHPEPIAISEATRADLAALGISDFTGLVPSGIFSWSGLGTVAGVVMIIVGGFLVGFGSRYAGGCTSGHAISGLADLQLPSLITVVGFFAGGLIATYLILPILL